MDLVSSESALAEAALDALASANLGSTVEERLAGTVSNLDTPA